MDKCSTAVKRAKIYCLFVGIFAFLTALLLSQAFFNYTEKEMKRRLLHIKHQLIFYRGFDILLTHAPAQGLGDGDDHAHQGYQTFLGLLDKYQPKYMVHGHMHLQYDHSLQRTMQYNNTQIINAYEKHSWEY